FPSLYGDHCVPRGTTANHGRDIASTPQSFIGICYCDRQLRTLTLRSSSYSVAISCKVSAIPQADPAPRFRTIQGCPTTNWSFRASLRVRRPAARGGESPCQP